MTDLRRQRIFSAALCAALLTSGLVFAQGKTAAPPKPPGPQAGGPGRMPQYNKATETTVKGPIAEVKLVDTPSGVQGTHLLMKQGQQTIEVFAGPVPFFSDQKVTFLQGTPIEVIGSKMQIQGINAMLARQIKMGGKTIVVRDESGKPAWAP
jgi:hypothetical protein